MATTYLVDGYNLLYAMGLLRGRTGPGGLERARLALIGLLRGALGEEAAAATAVFDAAQAPAGLPPTQEVHGIDVRYATGGKEADDLIEELLRHAGSPSSIIVVSDDRRLRQAADRRRAQPMACADFLDFLQAKRRQRPATPSPEKQEGLSEAELAHWLREFGDIASDPKLRELFEKFGL